MIKPQPISEDERASNQSRPGIGRGVRILAGLLVLIFVYEIANLFISKPLHSWRVLLLPYLGQEELYKQIRLDEPWNSTHNQRFHGADVSFYRCPSVLTARPGETTYSVVVGPEMPFVAGKTKSLADFGPDRRVMILLVERSTPVGWMVPANEVSQTAADAGINVGSNSNATTKSVTTGIASPHPGGATFGFRAGAVQFLSETMDLAEFRKLLRGTDACVY